MKVFSRIILYVFIFLILFGIFDLIISSFRENYPWPNLVEGTYGFRAYNYLKNDNKISVGIKNSFLIGIISTFISLILAFPIAKEISKSRYKKLISFFVLLPFVIGGTSVGLGLQQIFINIGLQGTIFSVTLVQIAYIIPYSVWILSPGFDFLDENKIYAAKMLGADEFDVFKEITIPVMSPFIFVSIIMGFILSFSQYYLTLVIGIGLVETYSTIIFPFIIVKDRALASAMSILFVVLNVLFIIVTKLILSFIHRRKRWRI